MAVGQRYELAQTNGIRSDGSGTEMGSKQDHYKSCFTTKLAFVLQCVIITCLLLIIVILAVLLARKTKLGSAPSAPQSRQKTTSSLNSTPTSNSTTKSKPDICLTSTCIETANRVNRALDPDVSPCDNFYQFACGGWDKKTSLPYYSPYGWSVLDEMGYDTSHFFRVQLQKPIDSSMSEADRKARQLYLSCISTEEIDKLGLSEAREYIEQMGGLWADGEAPYPEFDLTGRLIDLAKLGTFPLVKFGGAFHRYNKYQILLQVSPPEAPIMFSRNSNQQGWQMLAEELIRAWNDLYIDSKPPSVLTFLKTYYIMDDIKMSLDAEAVKEGYSAHWNETLFTIEELSFIIPSIDWARIAREFFPDSQIPPLINLTNRQFFLVLEHFISTAWKTRALDNYLKFRFVLDKLPFFPYEYRKFQENIINKVLFESPTWHPVPRWDFCVDQIKQLMPLLLAKWYIDDYVDKETDIVQDVDNMIERIRSTYISVLRNTELLDKQTSDFAIRKVEAMEKHIAFPPFLHNQTYVDEESEHVVADRHQSFFKNVISTIEARAFDELGIVGTLTEMERQHLWMDHAYVSNGYYAANLNRFTILAGILQGYFYNYENPKYMNFGSMGFTIGHEFTHGFDDTGRHFGIDGMLHSWWTETSEKNYEEAKRCYVSQYNELTVQPSDSNETFYTNGNSTLDENIADNGAEYVVFQAYEKWVEEHGEEKILPTPHLTSWQQLYYVAQAQGWCAKFTSSGLDVLLDTFEHSQKEARVNGMYQNSVRFSEIFQCPADSFMNPRQKCTLW